MNLLRIFALLFVFASISSGGAGENFLTVKDGVLQVISKARGVKAAHAALNKLVAETPQDTNMPAMVAHTGTDDADLTAFLESADLKWSMVPRGIVGSTVGTHTGPHLICLGYFKP